MSRASVTQRILLPGIVFQSVIVAGGYGTGRELVEFFIDLGLLGGIVALLCTALIWSSVCAITFEFSRRFGCYDYRAFFKKLLGPLWFLFEGSYIGVLFIVLSIVVASAGSIVEEEFGLNYNFGVVALIGYVCFMLYRGNSAIEKALSFWTVALYTIFGALFVSILFTYGSTIAESLNSSSFDDPRGSFYQGIRYAGYNLGLIPAVLFTTRHLTSKKEALVSGLLAGIITIIPAFFIFVSLFAALPSLPEAHVPTLVLLNMLDSSILILLYNVVMLMTLVETGIGLIHAFNERVINATETKNQRYRLYIGGSILLISAALAQLGLIDLIAKGYGILTWVIIAVYIVPLLTVGLYQLGQTHANVRQTT